MVRTYLSRALSVVMGCVLLVLALHTGRLYASALRTRRSIEVFRESSYGRFEFGPLEHAARLTSETPMHVGWPAASQPHIVIFIGDDADLIALGRDWITALSETKLPSGTAITIAAVEPTDAILALREAARSNSEAVQSYEVTSLTELFPKTGVAAIPFSISYEAGELRCLLSGRSSIFSIRACLKSVTDRSQTPQIEYTGGRSVLPMLLPNK